MTKHSWWVWLLLAFVVVAIPVTYYLLATDCDRRATDMEKSRISIQEANHKRHLESVERGRMLGELDAACTATKGK